MKTRVAVPIIALLAGYLFSFVGHAKISIINSLVIVILSVSGIDAWRTGVRISDVNYFTTVILSEFLLSLNSPRQICNNVILFKWKNYVFPLNCLITNVVYYILNSILTVVVTVKISLDM